MLEDVKKANPNITGSTVPSTPTATLMAIRQGKFNIGFSLTDATARPGTGKDYFKPTGPDQEHQGPHGPLPAGNAHRGLGQSDIKKIEQLKGKRVSPAAKGLSNDLEAQRLLKLYGMSYNDVKCSSASFEDSATSS